MHKCHNAHLLYVYRYIRVQCAYDFRVMYPYQSGESWILALFERASARAFVCVCVCICLSAIVWVCGLVLMCRNIYFDHFRLMACLWRLFAHWKWFWTFDPIRITYMGNWCFAMCTLYLSLSLPFALPASPWLIRYPPLSRHDTQIEGIYPQDAATNDTGNLQSCNLQVAQWWGWNYVVDV